MAKEVQLWKYIHEDIHYYNEKSLKLTKNQRIDRYLLSTNHNGGCSYREENY